MKFLFSDKYAQGSASATYECDDLSFLKDLKASGHTVVDVQFKSGKDKTHQDNVDRKYSSG